MALPKAREGISIGFSSYYGTSKEITIGNREQIVWSSIKHLCALGVADSILENTHGISNKKLRSEISNNIKLYINQACDFYAAATNSNANTSPLFYYYCYLNLAKALCEIKSPKFHRSPECYSHGISWRPNPKYVVNPLKESVYLSNRGVWHVLWEKVTEQPLNIANPTYLKIKDLLACCPETGVEYYRTFGEESKNIALHKPEVLYDSDNEEYWITFSVRRNELKEMNLSRYKFINLISANNIQYRQVRSSQPDLWTFELTTPRKLKPQSVKTPYELFKSEIKSMNPFVHQGPNDFTYYVPIQTHLPVRLPQLMLLYTLVFWLGALVRYDPHSVAYLQDSRFWIIIDGFLTQSRIMLLELFEWDFYKVATFLKNV